MVAPPRALRMLHGAKSFMVPPSSERPLPLWLAGLEGDVNWSKLIHGARGGVVRVSWV